MLSRFDLSRPIAIIDPVTILPSGMAARCHRRHRYSIGRRTSKRTRSIWARDHHKLLRAVGFASSRVAASPRRGSERDASVAIYLPLPLLISLDVPPTRRSLSRTHELYCSLSETVVLSCSLSHNLLCFFFIYQLYFNHFIYYIFKIYQLRKIGNSNQLQYECIFQCNLVK